VKTESTASYTAFIIEDHGNGMKNESNAKGAGIGLSIVLVCFNAFKTLQNIVRRSKRKI